MKIAIWILGASLGSAVAASAALPLWLAAPSRDNPHDPKSPFYRTPTLAGSPVQAATPSPVNAPMASATASPTPTASAPGASPTPTASGTPGASGSPTATPTTSPTALLGGGSATAGAGPSSTVSATVSPTPSPTAGDGTWPILTNFNADIVNDNAGANSLNPVSASADPQDGCGVSSPPGSSASLSALSSASDDGTPYLRLTYAVVANPACGYQYAAVGFPFITQTLSGLTGLTFDIRSGAMVQLEFVTATTDPCLGSNNRMTYNLPSTGGAWQGVTLFFSQFTPLNAGCPYPVGNVKTLSFSVLGPGSGTLDLDNIAFFGGPAPTATPSPTPAANDGAWPMLTDFNLDITGNNAGGGSADPNAVFFDPQDGCGVSSPPGSAATMGALVSGSDDGTSYLQVNYSVVANTLCGYQDAGVAFPFVNQQLGAYTMINFDILSNAPVEIKVKTASPDSCLGAANSMTYNVASTGGAWKAVSIQFGAFMTRNSACPFVPADLSNVGSVSFMVVSPGTGVFDLDNISFQ